MHVRLEFIPANCWIGACWRVGGPVRSYRSGTSEYRVERKVDVWVGVLPMVAIHVWWIGPARDREESR